MAGQPRKRAMIALLEKRTRDTMEEEHTPLDYLIGWTEDGRTLVQLASELSEETGLEISAQQLRRYADTLVIGKEGATESFTRARLIGGHSLVEQAMEIADEASTASREALTKAKLQIDTRLWTAERWNQRDLAQQKGVNVAISLPGLHLDAMRLRSTAVATISTPVLEGEIEDIDEVLIVV